MLTSFVTGTGKAFPKLNTLNCAFFFFSPPLPVLFSNLKPLNCLSLYHQLILAADKRDLVDLKSGDKIVNIDNTYVLQWPVTYKNLRASKMLSPLVVLRTGLHSSLNCQLPINPDNGDRSPISHPIFEFLTSLGTSAEFLTLQLGNSSPKYSNQIMNSRSFIIKECENQNWEGIITRIWPNTKYLDVIVTGLTIPSLGPSQRGGGKKYELMITTYTGGICRYRVGDILQVTRFHNSAPQFKFIIRKNVLLRALIRTKLMRLSCKTRLIALLQFCAYEHACSSRNRMTEALEEFDVFQSQLESSTVKTQLELYLEEANVDRKTNLNLDVLGFWKDNKLRYPELSLMAQDVLSVPITTVASKSAFSTGGRVIGKFRSSILPANAEAKLCTRDWIYGQEDLDGFESDSDEDEIVVDLQPYVDKLRVNGNLYINQGVAVLMWWPRRCNIFVFLELTCCRAINHGSPVDQLAEAGLTPSHIVATIFNILGQTIGVLEVMTKYTNVVHKCDF
ncbi:hypothetical protein KY290_037318 [Solanum tuberosum]|uniref:HAT C-terminal dimerisation domain-containing protein n=1 Tax=Solanum tuberosum TaxID=4113 RepID=A0ABQ7TVU6_SOLTU|nr:hypothetical protein KY285_036617 [Solanum tuberosum]KAH0738613.1 hypothetical protein KY290_037318 [Solanum tuberosum]